MKPFYTHLIEIESLTIELDRLDLTQEQKVHLASLVDYSLQHTILDAILSELSESDKRVFLLHLKDNDHQKIWQFLNGKIENIEEKIKKAAEGLKQELKEDIKKASKR